MAAGWPQKGGPAGHRHRRFDGELFQGRSGRHAPGAQATSIDPAGLGAETAERSLAGPVSCSSGETYTVGGQRDDNRCAHRTPSVTLGAGAW